jgi:hypothetical protein
MEWNGRGYHLALYYDGTTYGQTRLRLVTLSAAGRPEQHPWWVSLHRAGDVRSGLDQARNLVQHQRANG